MKVTIQDRQTPLVLEDRGPEISEREMEMFETRLGYKLPADYRSFLLQYNGGTPSVGVVKGRDDDPSVPYEYGDAVRTFLKLSAAEGGVSEYEILRAPAEIPFELPRNLLPIGEDSGGNLFVMELGTDHPHIRFLNHERLDMPFTEHRIVADNFLDLLLRFRTLDEQEAIDKARREAELRALKTGKFPRKLESQCRAAEKKFPEIRQWIRTLCVRVFTQKGYFAIHADSDSRLLLDLAFWLNQNIKTSAAITKAKEIETIVTGWFQEDEGNFGLNGYAPGFLQEWWADRLAKGALEGTLTHARFTEVAATKMFQVLREMRQDGI